MAVRFGRYFRTPRPSQPNTAVPDIGPSVLASIVPTPTPVPTPRTVQSIPFQTPSPLLGRLQLRLDMLHQQLMSELTPRQSARGGNIPDPIAVESIGHVGSRFVAGRAEFPPPGVAEAFIYNTVQSARTVIGQLVGRSVDAPRGSRTRISLETTSPEAQGSPESALRHETAHHVLASEGIPRTEHHPIISRARDPATGSGVDFRLLEMAVFQPRELSRRRLRLAFRELRRQQR